MADRNPSKKRRQAQNEAAREARASRAASARSSSDDSSSFVVNDGKRGGIFSRAKAGTGAGGTRPARTAAGVARATGTSTAPARPSRAAATKASAIPAKRGDRAPAGSRAKPATVPDEVIEYETPVAPGRPLPSWLDRFGGTEVGAKWVFFSFLATVFAGVALSVFRLIPQVDAKTHKVIKGAPMVTAFHSGVATGLLTVGTAPLVVLATILLARSGARRRTWYFGLAALAFLTLQSGYIYLAALVAMAMGCWQNRRAALIAVGGDPRVLRDQDRARRGARARRPMRAEVDSEDEVPDDEAPDED